MQFFVEGGPDLPTYSHVLDCGRVESQIDHVLCDEGVASALGEGQVLPGLSGREIAAYRTSAAICARSSRSKVMTMAASSKSSLISACHGRRGAWHA